MRLIKALIIKSALAYLLFYFILFYFHFTFIFKDCFLLFLMLVL